MDYLEGANLSSSLSNSNLSTHNNDTGLKSKIYVFLPLKPSARLVLLVLSVSVGTIALVGNILILWFVKTKRKVTTYLKAYSFQKNLDAYISSLAVSDALCAVIILPLSGSQVYFDFLQRGWGCKILRYLSLLFPSVTINNLMAISIGKCLSTCKNPRVFKYSTVKKLICFAWLSACVYVLVPAATFRGIRYDLNDTHYTVACRYDDQYVPFKIILLTTIALQYVFPCIVMITTSIHLILTLRLRMNRTVDVQRDNAIKAMTRALNRRAMVMVTTITLAFVIPYLFFITFVVYNMVATLPDANFETDFTLRHGSAIFAFSNGLVNVIIYIVQMKDFRHYLKSKLIAVFTTENSN